MKICVFGATGGIGRQVVTRALRAGHVVTALVRDPERFDHGGSVRVVPGELTDPHAVAGAIEGCDAVVWAVGPSSNTPDQPALFETAARILVDAMTRQGIRRLIALSGAGVTIRGENKPVSGRVASWLVRRAVRHVVEAKEREYRVFADSQLDWTLVRPPRVVDGDATGRASAAMQLRGFRVTQGDVAEVMLRLLTDTRHVRAAPYVTSR